VPSRRNVVRSCGLAAAGAVAGCTTSDEAKPVDVLLQNDDGRAWPVTVAVENETGETVFRATETVPADDGTLGELLLENAFRGVDGDQFTVSARSDGEPAGAYDCEITCPEDNRLSFLVENEPDDSSDEPVDYVGRRCNY